MSNRNLIVNNDPEFVAAMREAIAANNGYCPCVISPTEDDRCMCKAFRDKLTNPDFTGECHCGLYRVEAK